MEDKASRSGVHWAGLAILVLVMLAFYFIGGDPMVKLKIGIGYGLLFLVLLWGLAIFLDIMKGTIDLSGLLSEVGGGASMSRFQLLIFTFVVALSLFLIVAEKGDFPVIPPQVLTLLGISASTYAVSKGIQLGNKVPGGKQPTEIHEEVQTVEAKQETKTP